MDGIYLPPRRIPGEFFATNQGVSTNDNLYFDVHSLKTCYIMLCTFEKNVYLGDHVTPLIWNRFFSPSIVVVVNDELRILIVVPWEEKTEMFRYRPFFLFFFF
jgi:hypothetical protein